MKNCIFFGTSILDGFWEGFGNGLRGQNPRFSHFFRCFFDVVFQARFGRRKNREKMRKKQTFPLFGVGFAVVPRPVGKGKDRGFEHFRSNCAKECRDWPAVIGQSQLEINLARCWHTFGGRRIETPRGGSPPPTHPLAVWPPCDGAFVFAGFWAFLAFVVPNMTSKAFENEARALQNGGPRLPKSSPEASKTPIFKTPLL